MEKARSRALVIFDHVKDAMLAENVLKRAGYSVKIVAPPPEIRTGCDLGVEINIAQQIGIERELRSNNVSFKGIIYVDKIDLKPLELVKEFDFGEYLMVRCGNMKITFNKHNGVIVNVSGGGCPDVPYITSHLIGKKLGEAPCPQLIGYTLCAYTADRAYERALQLWRAM